MADKIMINGEITLNLFSSCIEKDESTAVNISKKNSFNSKSTHVGNRKEKKITLSICFQYLHFFRIKQAEENIHGALFVPHRV
jgi:hypothetical protein